MNELTLPMTSKVAGIARHQDRLSFIFRKSFFILKREPENKFDPNAIKVMAWGKHEVGYIPRELAAKLAPMMDRDLVSRKAEFVRKNVSEKHPDAPVGLTIKIYPKGFDKNGKNRNRI